MLSQERLTICFHLVAAAAAHNQGGLSVWVYGRERDFIAPFLSGGALPPKAILFLSCNEQNIRFARSIRSIIIEFMAHIHGLLTLRQLIELFCWNI